MRYPAHVVGGITFGILANYYLLQKTTLMAHSSPSESTILTATFISSSVIGSLFPDIDHPNSFVGKRAKPLSLLLSKTAGHRGATHAPLVILMLYVILSRLAIGATEGIQQSFLLVLIGGFVVGALSHLFLDSLTVGGIPLLYPFTSKHYRLARLKTGGIGEYLSILAMVALLVILSPWNNACNTCAPKAYPNSSISVAMSEYQHPIIASKDYFLS